MTTRMRRFCLCCVSLLALADAVAVRADQQALIIGISRYQTVKPELPGAVNDALCLQRVLVREYGFPEANIELLLDKQATLAGMRAAFQRLQARTKPGDTVLVHFSGHGTNLPDDDGDEARLTPGDLFDEALVTFDTGPNNENVLRDDELGKLLDGIVAEELVVVLDACCSGTGTKSLGGSRSVVRSWNAATVSTRAKSSFARDLLSPEIGTRSARQQRRVVFSACAAQQKARELELDHVVKGLCVGAFTYYLVEGLRGAADSNGDGRVTYGEVLHYVNRRLDEAVNLSESDPAKRQTPQVEYSAANLENAPVFGTRDKRSPHLRVAAVTGRQIWLDSGAIHGARVDQVLGLYRRLEDIGHPSRDVGRVKVTAITPLESQAELIGKAPIDQPVLAAPLINPLAPADLFLLTEIQREAPNAGVGLAIRFKQRLDRNLLQEPKLRIGVERGYELRLTFRQKPTNDVGQEELLVEIRDARDVVIDTLRETVSTPLQNAAEEQVGKRLWEPVAARIRELRLRRSWASLSNPQPSFRLQFVTDRVVQEGQSLPEYRPTDTVKFGLKATADCWYLLVGVDPQGNAVLFTPELLFAPAGKPILYPGPGQTRKIEGPSGVYVVKLIAVRQWIGDLMKNGQVPSPTRFATLDPAEWAESSVSFQVK